MASTTGLLTVDIKTHNELSAFAQGFEAGQKYGNPPLLIIRADTFFKGGDLRNFRKDIIDQAKDGVIILPTWASVVYSGAMPEQITVLTAENEEK